MDPWSDKQGREWLRNIKDQLQPKALQPLPSDYCCLVYKGSTPFNVLESLTTTDTIVASLNLSGTRRSLSGVILVTADTRIDNLWALIQVPKISVIVEVSADTRRVDTLLLANPVLTSGSTLTINSFTLNFNLRDALC